METACGSELARGSSSGGRPDEPSTWSAPSQLSCSLSSFQVLIKSGCQAGSDEPQTPEEKSEQQLIVIIPDTQPRKEKESKDTETQSGLKLTENKLTLPELLWYLSGTPG